MVSPVTKGPEKLERGGLAAPTHRGDKENTLKLHEIICSR